MFLLSYAASGGVFRFCCMLFFKMKCCRCVQLIGLCCIKKKRSLERAMPAVLEKFGFRHEKIHVGHSFRVKCKRFVPAVNDRFEQDCLVSRLYLHQWIPAWTQIWAFFSSTGLYFFHSCESLSACYQVPFLRSSMFDIVRFLAGVCVGLYTRYHAE